MGRNDDISSILQYLPQLFPLSFSFPLPSSDLQGPTELGGAGAKQKPHQNRIISSRDFRQTRHLRFSRRKPRAVTVKLHEASSCVECVRSSSHSAVMRERRKSDCLVALLLCRPAHVHVRGERTRCHVNCATMGLGVPLPRHQ